MNLKKMTQMNLLKKKNKNELSYGEHLKELKRRIFVSFLLWVVLFFVALYYMQPIINESLKIGKTAGFQFIYTSMQEIIAQKFHLAGMVSFILIIPFLVIQMIAFVSPVFGKISKMTILKIGLCLITTVVAAGGGFLFAYKILFPMICDYLFKYNSSINIAGNITFGNYLSFMTIIISCMGLFFEIPVISGLLGKIGLLKPQYMKKARKAVIVISFVVGAVITPPDVFSMIIVALPLITLYEAGIVTNKIFQKRGYKIGEEEKKEKK